MQRFKNACRPVEGSDSLANKKKQVVCVLSPTHKSLPDYSDDCLIALSVSFSEKEISEILWFQLLKCEGFVASVLLYETERHWFVDRTGHLRESDPTLF